MWIPPKHYPRGSRLSALERNELKRRALEMVLLLFYVEDLKHFVISSIEATDRTRYTDRAARRTPAGTKTLYKAAWRRLVDASVLTQSEAEEIEKLVDYRNLVAHQMHNLTGDIAHVRRIQFEGENVRYRFGAAKRARDLRKKVIDRMRTGFVTSLSFRGLWFEAAERTYIEELRRLQRKIHRQAVALQDELDDANATIFRLRHSGLLESLNPGHPNQTGRNGHLTERGIDCCRQLFEAGASPFVVAHLMRLSLRATTKQFRTWRT
jgi:uncharacterized protein YutE (UPF0331/DUF86 family)